MFAAERGVTMAELLVASSIAVVLVLGIGTWDGARVHREQLIRREAGVTSEVHDAALASLYLARVINQADRINVASPTVLQLRRFEARADGSCGVGSCTTAGVAPAPCCFMISENYWWDQYALSGSELVRFLDIRNPVDGNSQCGARRVLARDVSAAVFTYKDVAPPPEGGDPLASEFVSTPADTNAIEYTLTWTDAGGMTRTFNATVTSLAFPYSNLSTASGLGDSGSGVDVLNISPPPGPCL